MSNNNDLERWAAYIRPKRASTKDCWENFCSATTTYHRLENLERDDGSRRPFYVVPFYPIAEDPFNMRMTQLPELRTAQDIRNLNDDQLNSYLTGYRLEHLLRASRKERLRGLCNHIGCQLQFVETQGEFMSFAQRSFSAR